MKNKIKKISISVFSILPVFALAEEDSINSLKDLIERIVEIISLIIPLLISVAVVVFVWGLVDSIINADNEQKRKDGKRLMVYGVVILFVMVSVWGFVSILNNTFF